MCVTIGVTRTSSSSGLVFRAYNAGSLCSGYEWSIQDEDALASLVAALILGECAHVERVLLGETSCQIGSASEAVSVAVNKLQDVSSDTLRYHRDGWLFQMISWIAVRETDRASLAAVPHPQPAFKGFDSVIVRLNESGTPVSLVIGEDKATQSPRYTVKKKVWPEIRSIEEKQRESEIKSELTAIISGYSCDRSKVAELIKSVFWNSRREYRIAVAGPCEEVSVLYADYDSVAPGDVNVRRGETLRIEAFRDWFDSFSAKVVVHLQGGGPNV